MAKDGPAGTVDIPVAAADISHSCVSRIICASKGGPAGTVDTPAAAADSRPRLVNRIICASKGVPKYNSQIKLYL